MAGRPLVRDHENTTKGSVGRVTDAKYKEGVGVLYRANLYDEELASKVSNGQLEVSPRIVHTPVEELERDEESGAFEIDRAVFDNLSLVITGASKSNTVEMGDTDELSAEELAAAFEAGEDGSAGADTGGEEAETDPETDAETDSVPDDPADSGDSSDSTGSEPTSVDDDDDSTPEASDTESETEDSTDFTTESTDQQPEGDDSDPFRMIVSDSYTPTQDNFKIMSDSLAIDAEHLPESADEFSQPVVIERSTLDELESAAESDGDEYEELRSEMERLADAKEERDQLRDRVDELEEYEERLDEVDEMRQALASDLATDIELFDADELADRYSVSELREKIDAVSETDSDSDGEAEELADESEAEAEAGGEDPDPAPRGGTETEELDGELTDEERQRVEDLKDTIEWYYEHDWDGAAEELEAELDELTVDQ